MFSYKTHPDFNFIQAIYQSSTIPIIFQPKWYESSYYLDGGLLNNYPVDLCIENGGKEDEILGVRYNALKSRNVLTETDSFMDYLLHLFRKLFSMQRKGIDIDLKHQLSIIRENIDEALNRVLNHGQFIIGDTFTESENIKFLGIPSFAPEIMKKMEVQGEPVFKKKVILQLNLSPGIQKKNLI